ncbi:MAG: hypothetical protein KFB93_04570 [Simkaniaceae bacterium]|nr:MAG: hypothetical protein KFB93_04570 [Simkaniaceae bacterium]
MGITLSFLHHDLVTPDGKIIELSHLDEKRVHAKVLIENISPSFLGFSIEKERVFFNLKSTLAQLGVNASTLEFDLSIVQRSGEILLELTSLSPEGTLFLSCLTPGAYIGKLFAADVRRRVRDPIYLSRMFGRTDREGRPLLSLGEKQGKSNWTLEQIEGRMIAFLPLKPGIQTYDKKVLGLIPVLAEALKHPEVKVRELIHLTQKWEEKKRLASNQLLLVNTLPLHIRTVFGRVVDDLLPKGVTHTAASILQPDTTASGDIYELYGESSEELSQIPLEFYTLDPYREHVFFSDRDQLQASIENPKALFGAIQTAPTPTHHKCATFVVKGEQLLNLKPNDWIQTESTHEEFPGFFHPREQAEKVEKYMYSQPAYPFLEAIEKGVITSQGILLTRFFPSPIMKRMLLSEQVYGCLKGIYFEKPSRSHGDFFSHEDRSMLLDLAKFGISIFWLDHKSQEILRYVPKPGKDSGMFVPLSKVETFIAATMVGVYGSNLMEGTFEPLIKELLEGLLKMKNEFDHRLLNSNTPLGLVTGGGPGMMSVGNRIAKSLGILSCANILDFRSNGNQTVNEQEQNPYVEAKMTYRLDRLVERQAEFYLDLPIFLTGGIGTDFEYALEETRRKTGVKSPSPVLLIGDPNYWKEKITSRFKCNTAAGTIAGSEWVSNCFFCIQNASQGLEIYADFFSGRLAIGPKGPIFPEGFRTLD